ncbi:MAG: germination protein YpeB [Clostridia bacterium]|nr:germination protein YpeB [Clostridia bacterium]
MENNENMNNALEKAENIASENSVSNTVVDKKAERERIAAERRVNLARIKAHKRAEKQKAQAAALRERNRKKAEIKEQKQRLRAERQTRRDMLKKESKEERARRLQLERSARRDERAQVRREKEQIRRRKADERRLKRQEKSARRSQNKGVGGWIAAVVSLGLATLVLASVLTFTFLMPSTNDNMLESTYQKSFYDTVEQVDNIDLNLSKVLASKDSGAMQKYLVDTAINSELAENDIQQLPLHDESKYYTTKLINQIGDYSKYLNNKLINGESLTESDYQGLTQLYKANLALKQSLKTMIDGMSQDYSFSSMIDGGNGDMIISGFNELQNLSVNYPELIYDGPFSDGQQDREIKGLKGSQIDAEQAKQSFEKIFADYAITNVTGAGEASGDIECFNVQGTVKGDTLYAQISKSGGKLIMFAYAGSCEQTLIDEESAIEKAQEFMANVGVTDMKAVWINLTGNVYTINFAYEQDDVIVYSDLVKVRVCAETGMVIGLEAKSYYTNHTDRVIDKATLSEKQARQKVSDNIEIDEVRLAVVPIGLKSEKLCYEFFGEYDGSTYYVYIDANTGKQLEMFKVVEGTEGTLLM